MADLETEKKFWNRRAQSYPDDFVITGRSKSNLVKQQLNEILNLILQNIKPEKNEWILDIGCGCGIFCNMLSKKCNVVGIDIAKKMLDKAQEKDRTSHYILSEATNIPFQDCSFNNLVCISTFHHFPSYEHSHKVLQEMIRVVKHNGKIIISNIPVKFSLYRVKYQIFQIAKKILKLLGREENWLTYHLFYSPSFFYPNKVIKKGHGITVIIVKV